MREKKNFLRGESGAGAGKNMGVRVRFLTTRKNEDQTSHRALGENEERGCKQPRNGNLN